MKEKITITKTGAGYDITIPADQSRERQTIFISREEMGEMIEAIDGIAAEENGETEATEETTTEEKEG